MRSNREHDDSVFGVFTCICGKGWESSSKKMLARCALGGCSNTTNLQEVLRLIPYRFRDDRPEEKKRAKQCMGRSRESETCTSSVVCFKHFKPRSTPGFSGRGREFADSMA